MIPLTDGELLLRDAAPVASLVDRCTRVRTTGRGSALVTTTVHAIPYRWYTPNQVRLNAMAGGDVSVALDVLSFAADAGMEDGDALTDDADPTLQWTVNGVSSTTDPAFQVVYAQRRSN